MLDPGREAGVGDSRFEMSQVRAVTEVASAPLPSSASESPPRREQRRMKLLMEWFADARGAGHWVVGESQRMRGEESQCLASADWEEQSLTRLTSKRHSFPLSHNTAGYPDVLEKNSSVAFPYFQSLLRRISSGLAYELILESSSRLSKASKASASFCHLVPLFLPPPIAVIQQRGCLIKPRDSETV